MNPVLSLTLPVILLTASLKAGDLLEEHLEPLRPFLNKTWRGEFKNSTPEKPMVDIARWERALNGTAIRVLHSVNDGAYGGETILRWDDEKKQLVYFYFATAGFMTAGTLTISGTTVTAKEKVSGASNVAEIRSTSELRPDGSLVTKAEYLDRDGKVTGTREATYREDAKAAVKFK